MKTALTLLALALLGANTARVVGASTNRPVGLRCEFRSNPEAVDAARPRLSWMVESDDRGVRQAAYRILVSSSPALLAEDRGDLWDSGRVRTAESLHQEYGGKPLRANQACFWKVRVWLESLVEGDRPDPVAVESDWSDPARWTMGLLQEEDWQARWIGVPGPVAGEPGLPVFRRGFRVAQALRRARVHLSGLGQHELFLNGQKVGNRFLDPAWSVYERTVYYTTDDVTAVVRQGENVFGVMLGKGFYSTAGDRRVHGVNATRPLQLILQLHLDYADGSTEVVVSDGSWRVASGPITHCAILGGSDYDARRLAAGWCEPGFDDAGWAGVVPAQGPGGRLRVSPALPMVVAEVLEPVQVDEPEPGVLVYDFGQNASAIPGLRVRGEAGRTIRLKPAEQRLGQSDRTNDGRGRVNQAGVGQPNYWEYTLRGGGSESWSPQFTYSGFQYLELTGGVPAGRPNPNGLPVVESLTSQHVRNAAETVGAFACSDALVTDIHRMVDWAIRSNLGHVLTDCPHREKLGWLEVSYLMAPSIACRYDVAGFYAKILGDIRDSQQADGMIPTVAPDYPRFEGGFHYTPEWGAAGVILPWFHYQRYGDRRILEENAAMMRGFVDYLGDTSNQLIARPGLGDWYDYGHGQGNGPARFTPPELTATATFYRCAQVLAATADRLGDTDARERYDGLAERIRTRFNEVFFDGRDTYRNEGSPQTAHAMALVTGLVPPDRSGAVLERMLEDLRGRGYQQTAGDIGFAYLVEALAARDQGEVLWAVTQRRDLGGYGYIRDHGWTALPEAWDANTGASMNHCMLGHILQWFYGHLAGIQIAPDAQAGDHFIIRPQFVGDLRWVRAHHDSARGRIAVAWERDGGRLSLEVTVPANATATLDLPLTEGATVLESDLPLRQTPGVELRASPPGRVVLRIGSGTYRFAVR